MAARSYLSLGGSERGTWNLWVLGEDKLSQVHKPELRTPPHLFGHLSAQEMKADAREPSAWVPVQAPALARSMNWTEGPKTQFLYLRNGDNNGHSVTELFERSEAIYKMLSTFPRPWRVPLTD